MNEAALLAARRGRRRRSAWREFEEAIDRVIAGPERRSRVMSDEEKRVIAYHEAGHALVGHVLPNTDPIHKVSIIARGRALGLDPRPARRGPVPAAPASELRDELAMLLGGRTAEELIFGDPTTGAHDDIERATADRPGHGHRVRHERRRSGPQQFGQRTRRGVPRPRRRPRARLLRRRRAAASTPRSADCIDAAHDEAREILVAHRATLDRLAAALIERETLDESELTAIFGASRRGRAATTWSAGAAPLRRLGSGSGDGGPRLPSATCLRSTYPTWCAGRRSAGVGRPSRADDVSDAPASPVTGS